MRFGKQGECLNTRLDVNYVHQVNNAVYLDRSLLENGRVQVHIGTIECKEETRKRNARKLQYPESQFLEVMFSASILYTRYNTLYLI